MSCCTYCGAGFEFVGEHRPGCKALQPMPSEPAIERKAHLLTARRAQEAHEVHLGARRLLERLARDKTMGAGDMADEIEAYLAAAPALESNAEPDQMAEAEQQKRIGLILDAKQRWIERATSAEAALTQARALLEHWFHGRGYVGDETIDAVTQAFLARAPAQAAEHDNVDPMLSGYAAQAAEPTADQKVRATDELLRRELAGQDRSARTAGGMGGFAGEAELMVEAARRILSSVAEAMTEHAYQELASALESPARIAGKTAGFDQPGREHTVGDALGLRRGR